MYSTQRSIPLDNHSRLVHHDSSADASRLVSELQPLSTALKALNLRSLPTPTASGAASVALLRPQRQREQDIIDIRSPTQLVTGRSEWSATVQVANDLPAAPSLMSQTLRTTSSGHCQRTALSLMSTPSGGLSRPETTMAWKSTTWTWNRGRIS